MTAARTTTLMLCGDVMCGRGIDQVLPHPSHPRLHEPWVHTALGYVELAERAHGRVARPVGWRYVWGDALDELDRVRPAARVVNLETAVTTSDAAWPGKAIHYRMHPANVPTLAAAGLDVCALANNHVLDWGTAGLEETLARLRAAGLATVGAGADAAEAARPAVVALPRGRLLVYACGTPDCGIPADWAARTDRAGVNLLQELGDDELDALAGRIAAERRPGDRVMVSLHWGANWGYEIAAAQRAFAHGLIERAGVDLVHGHSSHHVKGIEVHRRKLILYGCGDLLTDYEGIGGFESFRGDLSALYFPTLDADTGQLAALDLTITRVRQLQVRFAPAPDVEWVAAVLDREGGRLGTHVERGAGPRLKVHWS